VAVLWKFYIPKWSFHMGFVALGNGSIQ